MKIGVSREPLYAIVRYRLKPEHIERSRPSAAELYAELTADGPGWLRQASFELDDLPLLDEPIPPMAGQCGVPISNDHPRPRPSSVMRTYERGRR
jgi:hypothetical protein